MRGDTEPLPGESNEAWTQFGRTPTHTGSNLDTSLRSPIQEWQTRIEGPATPPVVVGDTVYVYTGVYEDDDADFPGGSLLALDRTDGTTQWQTTFDDPGGGFTGCQPIVHHGSVYVGDAGRRSFYAVDARSGRIRWHRNLGGSVNYPAVAESGTVCLARQETLVAFDTMGTELWRYSVPGHVYLQTPAIQDGTLYAGSVFTDEQSETADDEASLLLALDIESGEKIWARPKGENFNAIIHDANTVFSSGKHAVHAVSASDGSRLWKRPLDTHSPGRLAVDSATIYMVGGETVTALDRTDGTVRWQHHPQIPVRTDPVVLHETVVVASEPRGTDENATVYGLDKANGETVWQVSLPGNISYSAAAVDDTVYLGAYRTDGRGVIMALSSGGDDGN